MSPSANNKHSLVLASASPRRRVMLASLGLPFEVAPADVDETVAADELPLAYVERVAQLKAVTVAQRCPTATVIGADTAVVLNDQIFGKPTGVADARRMLGALSGKAHKVITSVVVRTPLGVMHRASIETKVIFTHLSQADIYAYCDTSEPYDKAGAYAIQGDATRFVQRIDGSYSAVVGLPLCELVQLLAQAGITCRFGCASD